MECNATILIVDDEFAGRHILRALLSEQGYELVFAENGAEALAKAAETIPDLVLLDVMMPDMDGFEVCTRFRGDPLLAEVPIIMVTALDDRLSRVRGFESGAHDFIPKPFDRIELLARVGTIINLNLRRKEALEAQKELTLENERLLMNTLPRSIAQRLKNETGIIADRFDEVTVLFADIVSYTKITAHMSPTTLVRTLNELFSSFDRLTEKYGLEKIKTMGDKYMVAGGLPEPKADHAEAIVELALEMQDEIARFNAKHNTWDNGSLKMRIGINTGPVVAGIIGIKKFAYDLWGYTVNLASRIEEAGLAGHIQVTESTYERLRDKYNFKASRRLNIKGIGKTKAYLLTERKAVTHSSYVTTSGRNPSEGFEQSEAVLVSR